MVQRLFLFCDFSILSCSSFLNAKLQTFFSFQFIIIFDQKPLKYNIVWQLLQTARKFINLNFILLEPFLLISDYTNLYQIFKMSQLINITKRSFSFDKLRLLQDLGLKTQNSGAYFNGKWQGNGEVFKSIDPSNGQLLAQTRGSSLNDYQNAIKSMESAKAQWASLPMPARGQIVRQIGEAFRVKKQPLGRLISLQMGKIYSQGQGEVQEVIDVCDMASGLSRTIGGSVFNSERPEHFMMQVWNPLGIVGVITAFNFPCAVFGWNAAIALICGDLITWKGSHSTSLVTLATAKVIADVLQKNKINPNVLTVVQGGIDIGQKISEDKRIPLVSFTGSTKIGRIVQRAVGQRFGRTLLELGGNNATIIMKDANLDLAFKACTFAAVGTCGQRCTTLRRLIIHESVFDQFTNKLVKAYKTVRIGDPLDSNTLCGPLHTSSAAELYQKTIKQIKKDPSAKILCGGNRLNQKGFFVEPTIVQINPESKIIQQEYFCPILFVMKFKTLQQAIKINNGVPQGLSSSLFTQDISNAFKWVGPLGSDCGIANVNIGPSGAQIGGAFGGEKQTGGGRQSGSDSWKQYMRRSTCTINYGKKSPLAQGVNFDL